MHSVKLLSLLLCVLSVAFAQVCNPNGIACYPADCCTQYSQCTGDYLYPPQQTAPGTVCKAGMLVWATECTTPCPVAPVDSSSSEAPEATQAPATAAPVTQAPATVAPATQAPATQKPTTAPVAAATQAPVSNGACTASNQGVMRCSGGAGYQTCANGAWVSQSCAGGLICKPSGDLVYCDYNNGATLAPSPATQAPATQAPATQAPATQAPATQKPTQAPVTVATVAPATQKPTTAPVASATTKPVSGSSPFGQLLMGYYSGIGLDTIGTGGLNAIALAFFDPTPLATNDNCDFSGSTSACIKPAAGSGDAKTLGWAMDKITTATPLLSANTSPRRNGKPTIFISFGGYSQGGACWDDIFGSATKAATLGRNAAKLVNTLYTRNNGAAYIGFDLDIEETTTALPYMAEFITAFRANAAYDAFPLQLCTLSGLSDPSNDDHFKIGIMQQFGPATGGINFLNMMVANLDESCDGMSAFWMHPALNFLPAANKVLGMWGELLPSWVLHEPGCSTGNNLFGQIRAGQMGIGIWQWWAGATTEVTAVLTAVRSG